MTTTVTLGRVNDGVRPINEVTIDVEQLVEARMLLQANSGGGKSWAIRKLLEATFPFIQHIVIDVDDEFHTLREKHDYVLAGRHGGDCPANVRSAPLLARKLLELETSAILGIYELPPPERIAFVKLFLNALINAPRSLWHPVLVVLDEAHIFCPQGTSADSSAAVIDLMTRGRKRGFCGVLATQRIALLQKSAAAECNVKMIGRSNLPNDIKRANEELGFEKAKGKRSPFQGLPPGHFFIYGPAVGVNRKLSDEVIPMITGGVTTTHPKAGQRTTAAAPPPREKVRAVLAQLADLPAEAEAQERSIVALEATVKQLKGELTKAQRAQAAPVVDQAALDRARFEGASEAMKLAQIQANVHYGSLVISIDAAIESLRAIDYTLVLKSPAAKAPPYEPNGGAFGDGKGGNGRVHRLKRAGELAEGQVVLRVPRAPGTPPIPAFTAAVGKGDMPGPEQNVLDSLAWWASLGVHAPQHIQVAYMAGYSPNSKGYKNPRGALRGAGLLEYIGDGALRLTAEGARLARPPARSPTVLDLHASVLDRLDNMQRKILGRLLTIYPSEMPNVDLAAELDYSENTKGYKNTRGSLRTLGLITYSSPGCVRASDLLFPTGGASS